ncbi:MAG TPA: T9SS type A sorting domain-containing protein [Chitinophagales bacterium]|nr:T9SS type A sorting domain-containing protein [Chitinophagales bacterium]
MKIHLLLFLFIFGCTQINAQWTNFCTGNTDGFVVDFARYNNSIYSTGFFHTICDADAEFVASWDGSNWNSTDNSFDQEGHAIDSINGLLYASLYQFTTDSNYVYTYNGSTWSTVGNGVFQNNPGPGFPKNATIYDIIEYDGKVVACGDFDIAGDIVVNGIMQWDGTTWLPLGEGLTEFIPGMPSILYPHNMTTFDDDLIVCGNFNKAGGTIVNGIARWDGTTWHALGEGFNNSAYAVCVYDGELYAGGEFTMSGTTPLGRIAKWNGVSWENPGFEVAYSVTALHEFVHTLKTIDGKLYITGGFDQLIIDGVTTDAGSILAFDGTTIDTLAGGVEGEIEAIIEYGNGFLVAGAFTKAGGLDMENFAIYTNPANAVENTTIKLFEVYPNPAADYLQVNLIYPNATEITISDSQGRCVLTSTIHTSTALPISSLASGCYFITAKSAQTVYSELIFIE